MIIQITIAFDNKAKKDDSPGLFEPKIKLRNILKGTLIGIILLVFGSILFVVYEVLFQSPPPTV